MKTASIIVLFGCFLAANAFYVRAAAPDMVSDSRQGMEQTAEHTITTLGSFLKRFTDWLDNTVLRGSFRLMQKLWRGIVRFFYAVIALIERWALAVYRWFR